MRLSGYGRSFRNTIVSIGMLVLLGGCLTSVEETVVPEEPSSLADNNAAPTIAGNPGSAATVGQVYTFVPNASDPDGDTLTFSVTNLPGWARFNTSTGELSGQPTLVDEGVYGNIRISVYDGSTTVDLRPFSITVTQASLGSATLSIQAPATNTDGTPFTDLMAFKIYYGMTSGQYPNEIYINSPGISSYVVENLAPGSYYFVATAINGTGMESSFSNEVTRVVN